MFGTVARHTRPKVPRPRLNPGDPLVDDSLIFASAYGFRRGYTDRGAGDFGDRDARSHYRGFWTLGAGNLQYGGNVLVGAQAGWGCDNGDGVTGDSSQQWNATPARWQDLPALGATWAVSIRPDALQTNGQIPFFKRGPQPYGAANPGWRFTGAAGNLWRFNWSDGAAQGTIVSTTTQDANFRRIDFLVVRMQAGFPTSQVDFFVNGVMENTNTFAVALANPAGTEDTKIFGLGPANERFGGFSDVAYVWGRPLATPEILRLSADRFRPFRDADRRRRAL